MMGHQMLENESENLEFKNYKMSFMMSHTGNKAFYINRRIDETYMLLFELRVFNI